MLNTRKKKAFDISKILVVNLKISDFFKFFFCEFVILTLIKLLIFGGRFSVVSVFRFVKGI